MRARGKPLDRVYFSSYCMPDTQYIGIGYPPHCGFCRQPFASKVRSYMALLSISAEGYLSLSQNSLSQAVNSLPSSKTPPQVVTKRFSPNRAIWCRHITKKTPMDGTHRGKYRSDRRWQVIGSDKYNTNPNLGFRWFGVNRF